MKDDRIIKVGVIILIAIILIKFVILPQSLSISEEFTNETDNLQNDTDITFLSQSGIIPIELEQSIQSLLLGGLCL